MATPNASLIASLRRLLGEPRQYPVKALNFGVSDGTPSQTFRVSAQDGILTRGVNVFVGQEKWEVCNNFAGTQAVATVTITPPTFTIPTFTLDTLRITPVAGSPTTAGSFLFNLLDNGVSIIGGACTVVLADADNATAIATKIAAVVTPLLNVAYTVTDSGTGLLTIARVATGFVNTLSYTFVDDGGAGVTGIDFSAYFISGNSSATTLNFINNSTSISGGLKTVLIRQGATAAQVAQFIIDQVSITGWTFSIVDSTLVLTKSIVGLGNVVSIGRVDTDSVGCTFVPVTVDGSSATDLSVYAATDKIVQLDYSTGVITFGDGTNGTIPEQNMPLYIDYVELVQNYTDDDLHNFLIQAYKDCLLKLNTGITVSITTEEISFASDAEQPLLLAFAVVSITRAAISLGDYYYFKQQHRIVDTTKTGAVHIQYLREILNKQLDCAIRAYKNRRQTGSLVNSIPSEE